MIRFLWISNQQEINVRAWILPTMTQANWDHYARISYSPIIRAHYFFTVWRNYRLLLSGLEIPKGRLLEIGSSTGQISLRLAKKYKLNPTLVDSSKQALSIASLMYSQAKIELTTHLENVLQLNLGKKYDFVHSHGLLEHFKEKERELAFKNHVKHVKLKGWLVCWVPTPDFFYKINRIYLEGTNQWIFGYEKPLPLHDFLALFRLFNLNIRKVRHLPGWIGVAATKI